MQTSKNKFQYPDMTYRKNVRNYFDLESRMSKFGEETILLCRKLTQDAINKPLISQIIRSATSIGANYAEATCASSKKEAQETIHWIKMLKAAAPEREDGLQKLMRENYELILILQAIANKVNAEDKK